MFPYLAGLDLNFDNEKTFAQFLMSPLDFITLDDPHQYCAINVSINSNIIIK